MAEHNLFGKEAEAKAKAYLLNKGYALLEQNYRAGRAEVDLLMQKKEKLICIEVKARSTDFFELPSNLFPQKKSNFW